VRRSCFFSAETAGAWSVPGAAGAGSLHCSIRDGERSAKKIPYRVAQGFAREAQYRVIYRYRRKYPVKAMCVFFRVSRAAYYAWVKRKDRPDPQAERVALIQEAYQVSHQTYGYRRIRLWIQQNRAVTLNHKAVLRLMNRLGIRSIARKRKAQKRLPPVAGQYRYPNVLARDFRATQPNQKWVADVTYIRTQQGWAYLSAIKDLYDGFIVAHRCELRNSVGLVTQTLKQACQKEKVTAGLILHSDQGHQYRSHPYHVLVTKYNMTPSMSRPGNCWDNAPMENFFSHLKEEALRRVRNPTFPQARQIIDEYIYFFNYERIQLKTKQTPFQVRCLSG
jgi:putative transposase